MRRIVWILGAILGVSVALVPRSYAGVPGPLELQKTVGTDASVCATASQIVVNPNTKVYYCYKAINHGTFTLDTHSLTDDTLGPITLPNGGNFPLAPGAEVTIKGKPAGGFTINANTVNVATWMARGTPTTMTGVTTAPLIVEVTAVNEAEVVIGAKPAPALSDAALAFVAAAMLVFGAIRLNRKLRNQA